MGKRKQKKQKAEKIQKPLVGEVSTAGSEDLYATFSGDSVPNPDQVAASESGGIGLKLYEEMEAKDGHLASVLQNRTLALSGKEWTVEAASDDPRDQEIAEFVEENLKEIGFGKVVSNAMTALMPGFSVQEIVYTESEGNWKLAAFRHRKPSRFVFDKARNLRLLTESKATDGEILPDKKHWVYTFNAKYENLYGKGLGQTLYWLYFFKKHQTKFWAVFNEKFGSPTAIGKYPSNAGKTEKDTLLAAIDAIRQETGVTIPEGMAIELLEAKRQGSFATYEKFIKWLEASQSKVVLGQTLTTEQGENGARSLGEVHDKVRGDILKADGDAVCESFNNGPVKWLVDFNFLNVTKYPKVWIETEDEADQVALSQVHLNITNMGFRLDPEFVEETYGVKLQAVNRKGAEDAEKVKGDGLGKDRAKTRGEGEDEDGSNQPEFSEADDEDLIDPILDRALREASMGVWVAEVQKLVSESASFSEIQDKLLELYPKLESKDLAVVLEKALTVAELGGRFAGQGPDGE